MGGGGLMALGGELMGLGLDGSDPDRRQGSVRLRAREGRRPGGRRNLRLDSRPVAVHLIEGAGVAELSRAFLRYGEADWRKAAEAALKGARLESSSRARPTASRSIRSIRRPRDRARCAAGGAWRVLARLDHPDAAEANAQAQDDLANGADGLQVVFAGAVGAYGYGLEIRPATLHRAFEGVRFDGGAPLRARSRSRRGARRWLRRLIERPAPSRRRRSSLSASIRSPPRRARALPVRLGATKSLRRRGARSLGPRLSPAVRRRRRARVHAAGGTPAQELAFALGAAVAWLRALADAGFRSTRRARRSPSVSPPTPTSSSPSRSSARCGCCGRGSRRPAVSSRAPRSFRPRAPGG